MSESTRIDCDIHNEIPALETLYPYLPDHWLDYCRESAFNGPDAADYPDSVPTAAREDSSPKPDLTEVQDRALKDVEIGILNCAYRVQSVRNEDLAASLAAAVNQWQVEHWLEKEPRLRASIVVPSHSPPLAAKEVDRWGDHPGFVQVILPVRAEAPYGNRRYDPIYAAAVKHDLALGIHYGGAPGHPPTPTGWPSYFIEDYANMAQVFQSQVISLVCEGAFERFPSLRVALIEGGFTWLPSLMWRIDKEWKGLRHNTPYVRRPPSEYMRTHLRFTIQPLDAPPNPLHLAQILDQCGAEDLLMYASDYPHRHDNHDILLDLLTADQREKICSANARAFYRL
ncbi:MAG: amidohydrolase [Caldilineaceae bacterium SB0670_bin_27]|uniref:Amidohydrolase n=1 Tax=Caldilineaceae bacterium SB0664_bin_27 TaxID=2605260 RepID=A0A6B0YY72_9CHLR|nr:amidohydrolase [Caldilineaceae bacterium SB0664_bin_27]MYJ77388.1 amidohydrolase [Caldilineaceae bacterium SB0670_bin_27]